MASLTQYANPHWERVLQLPNTKASNSLPRRVQTVYHELRGFDKHMDPNKHPDCDGMAARQTNTAKLLDTLLGIMEVIERRRPYC